METITLYIAHILFWSGFGMILYVHLVHPLFLIFVSLLKMQNSIYNQIEGSVPSRLPTITLLIAAYNEEAFIEEKLNNSLDLDYPRNKLEIIVCSDGSTDNTDRIVKKFDSYGVILQRVEGRQGKNFCQNSSIDIATGEIIIFSDTPSMYSKNALKKIIVPFSDPKIGGVAGRVIFNTLPKSHDQIAGEESLFVRFSQLIKKLESKASMPVGASGAIFAIRKKLAVSIPVNVADDLIRPLEVIRMGYRLQYVPEAVATEKFDDKYIDVYRKKVRSGKRAVYSLRFMLPLLNPFKYGIFSLQFLTKTLLRRLLFPAEIAFFSGSFILSLLTHDAAFIAILFGIALFALIGYLGKPRQGKSFLQKSKMGKICQLAFYYHLTTFGAFKGIISGLFGEQLVTWKPYRQNRSP